jgi:hypothetical protein
VVAELGGVGDPVQRRLRWRPEERAACEVAVGLGEPAEVFHERRREVVPGEHFERRGRDEGGGQREAFQQRVDARAHVASVQAGPDRCGAGKDVEVVALGVGES